MPERQAIALPDGVTGELAVSLGVPAMTAHRVLFADGPVTGKTVLVAGGAGAVGHFAIELAKHAGARVVTTVSGPAKAELAAKAGADLVVNYREPGAVEKIKAFGAVDRIAEVDLNSNLDLDLAVLSPNSQIITYASTATDPVVSVRACMNANVSLRFVLLYGVPAERARPGRRRHHHGAAGWCAERAAGAPVRPRRRGRGAGRRSVRCGRQGGRRSWLAWR